MLKYSKKIELWSCFAFTTIYFKTSRVNFFRENFIQNECFFRNFFRRNFITISTTTTLNYFILYIRSYGVCKGKLHKNVIMFNVLLTRKLHACAKVSCRYDVGNGTRSLSRSIGRFL